MYNRNSYHILTSPSSSKTRRSTPWAAGCWGPKLSVRFFTCFSVGATLPANKTNRISQSTLYKNKQIVSYYCTVAFSTKKSHRRGTWRASRTALWIRRPETIWPLHAAACRPKTILIQTIVAKQNTKKPQPTTSIHNLTASYVRPLDWTQNKWPDTR